MVRRITGFITGVVLMLTGLTGRTQTPRIDIKCKGLYPEGTAYDKVRKCFYLSSVTQGNISRVDVNGNFTPWYTDSSLKSSFGMKVDYKRNRLWVCTGDPNNSKLSDGSTKKKLARLIAIDLTSAKKVEDIDVSNLYNGEHFINDLAFDEAGNIYITDSYSPVIYKVDVRYKAGVLTESDLFKGLDIGLNGIAFHPGGFLLVDDDQAGALYKVDLKDPGHPVKVAIATFFPGADGLWMVGKDTLILVQNKNVEKVYQLVTTDNWKTASVAASTLGADRLQQPSSVTRMDNSYYVLNSKVNELSDPTKKPSPEFSLQLLEFRPSK